MTERTIRDVLGGMVVLPTEGSQKATLSRTLRMPAATAFRECESRCPEEPMTGPASQDIPFYHSVAMQQRLWTMRDESGGMVVLPMERSQKATHPRTLRIHAASASPRCPRSP